MLDFIANIEHCSIREAALKLQAWFDVTSPVPSLVQHRCQSEAANAHASVPHGDNKPLPFAIRRIDPAHPYLAQRGVDRETTGQFGIGYNRGTGSMAGRIVIPIHDEEGVLIAYAGRPLTRQSRSIGFRDDSESRSCSLTSTGP